MGTDLLALTVHLPKPAVDVLQVMNYKGSSLGYILQRAGQSHLKCPMQQGRHNTPWEVSSHSETGTL